MPRALPSRRRSPVVLALAPALALLTVLAACTPEAAPAPTPTPTRTVAPSGDGVLRVGTLLPTTGGSLVGAAQLAGVHAAVREINAAGGVGGTPVEVISRDSGDVGAETAEASFAALVERGVDVVIGPSSSELVERVLPLAIEAGIPLISPAASAPGLGADADGFFARTVADPSLQGAVLARLIDERRAREVALIVGADELSASIATPLEEALADAGIELVVTATVTSTADTASAVDEVVAAAPNAVVLATPDSGETTVAILAGLAEAGYAGSRLWLTSRNLGDYSQALPPAALQGVSGILDGVRPDAALLAKLRVEDPGLGTVRHAAEAYDATVIAALAAMLARDDGGPSIAWRLGEVTRDGIRCTSFGECAEVLRTEPAIAYDGVAGALRLDAAGTPTRAAYEVFRYDAENRPQHTGTAG